MRKHPIHIALFLLLIWMISFDAPARSLPAPGPDATSQNPPSSFANLVEELLPAVVNISSTQKITQAQDFPELPQFPEGSPFEDFFQEFMDRRDLGSPSPPPASLGSGFVIDAEKGYIVTNNHVIRDAETVRVTFQDDETVDAEVIGMDDKTDLAVLKITTKRKLTAVGFGNSDKLRVGDWIVAIGNPFGLGGTVTAGIISARQRDINSGPYDDYLQTDASINRGNSGGPMFDLSGKVIGINTAIFSPSGGSVGIGFAIPSALAKPVIDQIVQYGRTRRGWIGVRIQQVTEDIAESLQLDKPKGALIASITENGPAAKAGIQAGDIIIRFNNQDIIELRDLPRLVAAAALDSEADIVVWRGGKEIKLKVKVGELEKAEEDGLLATGPTSEAAGTKIDDLGLTLEPLSDDIRGEFGVPVTITGGVIITAITPKSEAAEKGLIDGDVIVEINQQEMNTPKDVQDIVDSAKSGKRSSILLLINRAGDVRFVALKLK